MTEQILPAPHSTKFAGTLFRLRAKRHAVSAFLWQLLALYVGAFIIAIVTDFLNVMLSGPRFYGRPPDFFNVAFMILAAWFVVWFIARFDPNFYSRLFPRV